MANKIAIITGGSRGLGRNTAVNLARRGVDILFTYRANQKEAESFIREAETMGRKAAGFRFDTGDIRAFDGFVDEARKTLQAWERDRLTSTSRARLTLDLEGESPPHLLLVSKYFLSGTSFKFEAKPILFLIRVTKVAVTDLRYL